MKITKNIRNRQQWKVYNLLAQWGVCPDTCSWPEYESTKRMYWQKYETDFPEFETFCKFAAKWVGV